MLLLRKINSQIPEHFCNFVIFCRALNGIGKWNEDISTTLKHEIEKHWKTHVYSAPVTENNPKEKFYVLSMFPYPSGKLHMGHVRVYTISDAMARFYRMNGKKVIHPMGWDAFGLPAENAAIEHSINAKEWTKKNIEQMKQQLIQLGCSFDWEREFATCDSSYYKWTQFLFLKLLEADLAYQKESLVNWDPVDETVLADEQVNENGFSWRSGAKVEKKILKQWFVRTTQFSKSLLEGLNDPILENWRDIKKLQKHWIGDCCGINLDFVLEPKNKNELNSIEKQVVTVWTSVPELVHEASFIAIMPNSVLDRKTCQYQIKAHTYNLLPYEAVNPFTGQRLPVFVTDLVTFNPGADTHLGIPMISETDKVFAVTANIPLHSTPNGDNQNRNQIEDIAKLRKQICHIAMQKKIGGYITSSKLRDWLISRQRYWGTPIPIIHCNKCGAQPVPYSDLPVSLPEIVGKGKLSLKEATDWLKTKCPRCGDDAVRETDTMDTFVDSSWYFLRFLDPENVKEPFSKDIAYDMMPVDLYIGGKEHAVLHLYYARFMNQVLHSFGLVPHPEPFKRLIVQGMVMGKSYRVKGSGTYLSENQVEITGKQVTEKATGKPVVTAWEKMSKSKHNGVDPEKMFMDYGVDTTRLIIIADVAPTSHRNWSSATFPGIMKWQHRLWLTIRNFLNVRSGVDSLNKEDILSSNEFQEQEDLMFDNRNYYIKGVTFNFKESYQLSVAISKMQGLTNSIRRASKEVIAFGNQFERALAVQIIMLAPIAPHFASELWSGFSSAPNRLNISGEVLWDKRVLDQPWPEIDPNYKLELICMVNQCEQCSVRIPKYEFDVLTHDHALELAFSQVPLQRYISGLKIVDTHFMLTPNYEATINILTEKMQKEVREVQDVFDK